MISASKALTIGVLAASALVVTFFWIKKAPQEKGLEVEFVHDEELSIEKVVLPQVELVELAPQCVEEVKPVAMTLKPSSNDQDLPQDVDFVNQLFQPYPPLLPVVETVTYVSRVAWLAGRSAYLGDYAAHYQTSKHFISRSLHGVGHYLSDVVSKGDRFNVFRTDKKIELHLVLDLSRLKLWLYYFDSNADQKVLLKTYPVCAGRLDSRSLSGSLTPLGTYALGGEGAVYQEKMMGLYRNETKEMITVFGSRWIPLGREVARCTASSKGLGLQGVPWVHGSDGKLKEQRECIGKYESGGCIRLMTEDIEELFALVSSKPTFIHIVKDFFNAQVPGKEIL